MRILFLIVEFVAPNPATSSDLDVTLTAQPDQCYNMGVGHRSKLVT